MPRPVVAPHVLQMSENMTQRGPEWTCNEVLRLIKEYGQRPALWDPESDGYKNKFRKHQDWSELANIFNCNKLEVERKMKILNSQYRRETVKALKLKKAGIPHRITWYAYKSFSFLNKNLHKPQKSYDLIKEEKTEEEENPLATTSTDLGYVAVNSDDDNSSTLNILPFESESYGISEQNKETENVMSHSSPIPPIQQSYNHGERDEWAIFGELIAHSLRKLPDERTRCIVKHKINTVLYEAELSIYK